MDYSEIQKSAIEKLSPEDRSIMFKAYLKLPDPKETKSKELIVPYIEDCVCYTFRFKKDAEWYYIGVEKTGQKLVLR